MRLKNLTRLLIDAHKRELENKLWQQWLVDYQRMDGSSFMSFKDYKDKAFNKVADTSQYDKEKIIEEAEIIKKAHQKSKQPSTV